MLPRSKKTFAGLWPRTRTHLFREKRNKLMSPPAGPSIEAYLDIPIVDKTPDDVASDAARMRGQYLARQDRWDDLSAEMRAADSARLVTPGGTPIAELLAFGARSDVVNAAEHALHDDGASQHAAQGIQMLEAMRADYPDDAYISLVVAHAHLDVGWAWRAVAGSGFASATHRDAFNAHFDRAHSLMAPFCKAHQDSPLLAATCCALLTGDGRSAQQIADLYETLIDLDPTNHRHMRALGHHMRPAWFGSYDQLDLEARRTASRLTDVWGAGGYTWVYFNALTTDTGALDRVDVDFFLDGLRDIADFRPDQEMINLLAAFCSVALPRLTPETPKGSEKQSIIAAAAQWLIRDNLTELHPMTWAHAEAGFDNNAQVTSPNRFAARGRSHAMRVLADLFQEEIRSGMRVIFTPDGPRLQNT